MSKARSAFLLSIGVGVLLLCFTTTWRRFMHGPTPRIVLPDGAPASPTELYGVFCGGTIALFLEQDHSCALGEFSKCNFGLVTHRIVPRGQWSLSGGRLTLEPTNRFGESAIWDTMRYGDEWILVPADPVVKAEFLRAGVHADRCLRKR